MTATIVERIESLLPDSATRRRALRPFADAMQFISERRPEWCHVRFEGRRLRLFAGRLIVMTVEHDGVWLAVPKTASHLSALSSWEWDSGKWAEYRRVSSRNGYYRPIEDKGDDWPEVRREHFAYLVVALESGVAPDPRTVAKHDEVAAAYIETVVRGGRDGVFVAVAEPDISAIEGQPRLVSHLRRERDPSLARAKRTAVLRKAGKLECEACGFDTASAYTMLSGDVCEVHHRKALSEAGDGLETTIDDLAILCPNCHRAIHLTIPLISVEQFRAECLHWRGS